MVNQMPKVAIVCDWLLGTGGAERVVLELHRLYPKATIYTSQYDPDPKLWYGDKWFEGADIRVGWLQKLPKSLKKFLPVFRAWYFSRLDLSGYDLVISSSGAEAKGIKTSRSGFVDSRWGKIKQFGIKNTKPRPTTYDLRPTKATHVAYIHSPTHYYWSRYEEYLAAPGFGFFDPLARLGLKLLVGPMRRWDYKAAQRPDYLIANSNHTKEQIKKYYGRDSTVIHPPVDVDRFKQPKLRSTNSDLQRTRHGFVTAGRQTPYKKIDLAVKAASQLNAPLVVIGKGPDHKKLKRLAGRSVTFLTKVSDEQIAERFGESKAFIFPGVDDFGIVAVEAMAAGTPVITYKAGGALDYVNSDTGLFFNEQTPESLSKALQDFENKSFDHAKITRQAAQFSPVAFQKNLRKLLAKTHR